MLFCFGNYQVRVTLMCENCFEYYSSKLMAYLKKYKFSLIV